MKTVKEILDEIDRLVEVSPDVSFFSALIQIKEFIFSNSSGSPKDCNHEWSGTEWDYCITCKYETPVPGQECEHEWSRVHDINVCLKCKKREAYSK